MEGTDLLRNFVRDFLNREYLIRDLRFKYSAYGAKLYSQLYGARDALQNIFGIICHTFSKTFTDDTKGNFGREEIPGLDLTLRAAKNTDDGPRKFLIYRNGQVVFNDG